MNTDVTDISRVALVHDFLLDVRGAERVFLELCAIWPQGDVFTTVQQIAKTGVTVLVVEQNVRGALLISDRALVMEQGRKFMEGPAAEVRTDPRIRQAYLGGNIQPTAA